MYKICHNCGLPCDVLCAELSTTVVCLRQFNKNLSRQGVARYSFIYRNFHNCGLP